MSVQRNEILQAGEVVYLCQDKIPPYCNHAPTARLISVEHLAHYKDAWRAQILENNAFITWYPNKVIPIKRIIDKVTNEK